MLKTEIEFPAFIIQLSLIFLSVTKEIEEEEERHRMKEKEKEEKKGGRFSLN